MPHDQVRIAVLADQNAQLKREAEVLGKAFAQAWGIARQGAERGWTALEVWRAIDALLREE
jgi:hypothetical protein